MAPPGQDPLTRAPFTEPRKPSDDRKTRTTQKPPQLCMGVSCQVHSTPLKTPGLFDDANLDLAPVLLSSTSITLIFHFNSSISPQNCHLFVCFQLQASALRVYAAADSSLEWIYCTLARIGRPAAYYIPPGLHEVLAAAHVSNQTVLIGSRTPS